MRYNIKSMVLAIAIALPMPALSITIPEPPKLSSDNYILMDYLSGEVLASSGQNQPSAPASFTKLMTAYLVGQEISAGRLHWQDKATVSVNAWSMKFPNSSKMFIQPKDEVEIENLLKGVIVQSGNDACVALAEHIAGNETAFIKLMNEKAKEIGMKNTHYVNVHGLDGDGNRTTPYDTALLMQRIIKDTPEVYHLYKIRNFTWNKITQYNRNKLLWDKSLKVDGGKTGYTRSAGYGLTASAKEGRLRLISVIMGTDSKRLRVEETRKLLSYGFRFFDTKSFAKESRPLTYSVVWKGEKSKVSLGVNNDVYITLPRKQIEHTTRVIEIDEPLEAPLSKGQVVGVAKWQVEGETVYSTPLVTKEAIQPASWFGRTIDSIRLFFSSIMSKFSD